jgi:hypothetical protein
MAYDQAILPEIQNGPSRQANGSVLALSPIIEYNVRGRDQRGNAPVWHCLGTMGCKELAGAISESRANLEGDTSWIVCREK